MKRIPQERARNYFDGIRAAIESGREFSAGPQVKREIAAGIERRVRDYSRNARERRDYCPHNDP